MSAFGTRYGMGRRLLAAWLLVVAGTASAAPPRPAIIVIPGGPHASHPVYPYAQTLYCWSDVRLHHTLRHGNFPYCREKLRYRPGAYECVQMTDQVCSVLVPGSVQPVETRSQLDRHVFPCPDGPQPPVCRRLDVR
jgi:hypothetical protein